MRRVEQVERTLENSILRLGGYGNAAGDPVLVACLNLIEMLDNSRRFCGMLLPGAAVKDRRPTYSGCQVIFRRHPCDSFDTGAPHPKIGIMKRGNYDTCHNSRQIFNTYSHSISLLSAKIMTRVII